jgi:hypothetical protein
VLTLISSAGEVRQSVTVAAGRTVALDIPVYSGWVEIFAPLVLNVVVAGRPPGTTEDARLMLPPGRHVLAISNAALGFTSTVTVDVKAGEISRVSLDPRGAASFNAVPWAEVWLEGQPLGETPLANLQVPLGLREFVFRHPEFGERRVSATIRGDAPAAVAVDFTKSPGP